MKRLERQDLFGTFSYEKGKELPPSEWDQLEPGHLVMVQRGDEPLSSGEVDVRAYDADVFWMWLDGGRGRVAVWADERTHVWLPRGYRLRALDACHPEPTAQGPAA